MIQFNDFKRQWLDTEADTLAAVKAVGESGWYILGDKVREFEHAFAAAWGTSGAVGVASGLDAIELSLRALGCQPGDKVLTTPISAFATTLAIVKLGAVPVFVDCDRFGLIDLDLCEKYLRSRQDAHFFVPVHLYGHSLDLGHLARLRDEFNLRIVEDCAQSIHATFRGVPTGTIGQLAATSFYPTKNLGALGDGGAVLIQSESLAGTVRVLRDYGQSRKYEHNTIGYNSRLDELHAAILRRAHLPRLDAWTARRREIASGYVRNIGHPHIRVPGAPEGSDSCWHLFPIFIKAGEKPAFMAHMRDQGIAVAEHYPIPIFEQRAMSAASHEFAGTCEHARQLCASEVSLPIHPYLTDDEVASVIENCNAWVA